MSYCIYSFIINNNKTFSGNFDKVCFIYCLKIFSYIPLLTY